MKQISELAKVIAQLRHEVQEREKAQRAIENIEREQRHLAVRQTAVLNALPAHIALLNNDGLIMEVNEAWRRFGAENQLETPNSCVGQNYLHACEQARGESSAEAQPAAEGIRGVLQGHMDQFSLEYPCDSPTETRWFRLTVTPLIEDQRIGVVVMHVNITDRKLAEVEMARRNHQLDRLSQATRRVNSVLEVPVVLRELISAALALTGAKAGSAGLIQHNQMVFSEYIYGDHHEPIDHRFDSGQGIFGEVIKTRKPFISNGAAPDPHIIPVGGEKRVIPNLANVPIFDRHGNLIGCFEIHDKPGGFDDTDVVLLQGLAASAAVALDNATMLGEQHQSEETLRQSEERLRLMVDSVKDYAIILLDSTGCVTSWNSGAERLTGYSSPEIIGKHFSIFYRPEDRLRGLPEQILAKTLRDGNHQLEGWRLRKGGTQLWSDVVISAVRDGQGQLRGFVKVTRDMTERRQTEEALRQFNFALQSIFDAAPVALLSFDIEGRITNWSAGAERIFGWTEEESLGRLCPIIASEDLPDFKAMIQRVVQNGPENLVRPRVTKSGRRITAKLNPAPLRDQDGNVNGVMVIIEDITEKEKAEAVIRESEHKLRKLAHELEQERSRLADAQRVANIGSWQTSLPSNTVIWSEQNYRIFELDPTQSALSHADFLALVHPADRQRVDDAFIASLTTCHHHQIEHRIVLPDGRIKVIEERWQVSHDSQGAPVRVSGTSQDITKRHEADEALLAYQRQFEVLFRDSPIAIGYGAFRDGKIINVNHRLEELFGWSRDEIVGRKFDELGLFAEPFAWRDLYRLAVWRNRRGHHEVRLRRRSGEAFDGVISFARLTLQHELVLAVMILDVTELNVAKRELNLRARQQSGLAGLSQQALASSSLQTVMDAAVLMLTRTMQVNYGKVLELMPNGSDLKLVSGVGWQPGLVGQTIVDGESNSQAGFTLRTENPVVVTDLRHESRFDGPALLLDHGIISGISVMIGDRQNPWGVLGVHSAQLRTFSDEDIKFVSATANVLATAIARTQAEQSLQKLSGILLHAEDAERRRIARELHDSTVQDLVAAMMNLEFIRERMSNAGAVETQQVEDSLALLENCAHDIRTLSYRLHPPRLDEAGLASAIRHYLDGFGERTGLRVLFEPPMDIPRLEGTTELALFRVVQEALGNIHRHSRSQSAEVRLQQKVDQLVLEITDEGCGLPAEFQDPDYHHKGGGVGITSMRERLRLIGGQLEIKSGCHGTTIRAILPSQIMPS